MKKNLLKLFLILSLSGNIAALLFYSDLRDAEELKPEENSQAELLSRINRLALKEQGLQARKKKQRRQVEKLTEELNQLKARALAKQSARGQEASSKVVDDPGKDSSLRAKAAREGVKKALLAIGEVDENGRLKQDL
ncbi:MAG: hypothetical protein P1V97_21750, partial [Planctomycetota bacterium]|nr:hypothetical protein [Planctomycetota bacterium]